MTQWGGMEGWTGRPKREGDNVHTQLIQGFLGGSVVKNPPANAGDTRNTRLIPVSGRSPGLRNGNPLQYLCLENSMDRGTWQATVHEVAKVDRTEHSHKHTADSHRHTAETDIVEQLKFQ